VATGIPGPSSHNAPLALRLLETTVDGFCSSEWTSPGSPDVDSEKQQRRYVESQNDLAP
jgi:hypothetical protein